MDSLPAYMLVAPFLAGLMGGVHCAAMCGPLVGIACGTHAKRLHLWQWLRHALAYNAGRISTYVAAGVLTGGIGASGLALRGEPLTQQVLLAVMGVSLIVLAAYLGGVAPIVRGLEMAGAAAWRRLQPYSRRFLPADTPARAFGLGLIFGWLPCGMVYVALLAALATADPLHGALVMAAFGVGTLPNLLAISAWFKHVVGLARGRLARSLAAVLIAGIGIVGIAKAVQPATVSVDGSWCLNIPGVAAVFGGGKH
jgi:sulfite exporter TauE/SafE